MSHPDAAENPAKRGRPITTRDRLQQENLSNSSVDWVGWWQNRLGLELGDGLSHEPLGEDEIRRAGTQRTSETVWEVQVRCWERGLDSRCSKIWKGKISGKRTAWAKGLKYLSTPKLQILYVISRHPLHRYRVPNWLDERRALLMNSAHTSKEQHNNHIEGSGRPPLLLSAPWILARIGISVCTGWAPLAVSEVTACLDSLIGAGSQPRG